jgi:TRAP-type C4-dicarboxylate transport system permease small subunit
VVNRALDRLIDVCGAIAMSSITAVGVLIAIDVFVRGMGWGVVYGGTEIVEYLVFVTAFYSAPWVLRQNGHIRVDFLLQIVPRSVAYVLEVLADAIASLVVFVILVYAARIGLQSFVEHRLVFRTFFFPAWWIYAAACAALLILLLEFLRRTMRALAGRVELSTDKSNW